MPTSSSTSSPRPEGYWAGCVFLFLCLMMPAVPGANLLCFYSYITPRNRSVELILSECPPTKLCFTADGRYGNYSALIARGCMWKADCSKVHPLVLRGTRFTMQYACCDYNYCNSGPRVTAYSFPLILTLLLVSAQT
ncbi:protein Bouncer [Osmerus eperlanus]|uniref:protein Bouncer n=1 Tax=Osmerus eperlanus TaxID=29151 RepID=UPI002E16330B